MDRGPTQVEIYKELFPENDAGWIYSAHNPKDLWIKKNGEYQDILVLIVRNYRECLTRHHGSFEEALNEIRGQAAFNWLDFVKAVAFIQCHNHYFNNLRCYDFWDPAKRFLIYYEDLIQHPHVVLSDLARFFKVDENTEAFQNFIASLDDHIHRCLGMYEAKWPSFTKGNDVLYHSKKMGPKNCELLDREVKLHFPYYFHKYLSRYEWL